MGKIGYKIKLAHNMFKSIVERNEIFQKSALTRTEYMILNFVFLQKQLICMKDVQERFNFNRSTCSELLTSLENKGFVEKLINEYDTRIKYIKIKPQGKKEYLKIVKQFEQIDAEFASCFTEEEQQMFSKLLDKILDSNKKGEVYEKVCVCKNKKEIK